MGLPVGSGVVLAFDAATGFLAAILIDNGYLTDLRTGAAGAVAVRHLAPATIRQVAFIGAATQARFPDSGHRHRARYPVGHRLELETRPTPIASWAKSWTMPAATVQVAQTIQEAVSSSDLVITTTPSRQALVFADWVRPGTTLIAVGSDTPDKQELDPGVLTRADMVITELIQGVYQDREDSPRPDGRPSLA